MEISKKKVSKGHWVIILNKMPRYNLTKDVKKGEYSDWEIEDLVTGEKLMGLPALKETIALIKGFFL